MQSVPGHYRWSTGLADPEPMINTTPLIDLMLVLLVMFIVSIPVATHKVPMDVGSSPPPREMPTVHRLDLDSAGRIHWNGREIPDSAVRARLSRMAADPAWPILHIGVDGETRYERVDEVLGIIGRAGITRMGFVGNERFAAALKQAPH